MLVSRRGDYFLMLSFTKITIFLLEYFCNKVATIKKKEKVLRVTFYVLLMVDINATIKQTIKKKLCAFASHV